MIDIHHLPGTDLHESQIYIFRKHPITLLPAIIVMLIVLGILPVAYSLFQLYQPDLFASPDFHTFFVLIGSVFFLFGWLFAFQLFVEYWLDTFIVTDKRILDIDQRGLFGRTVSELRLFRTQDVTAEVNGFLHTLLDYGDVYVQTAGETERFHFENISHPNHVAKMILELAETDRKCHADEMLQEVSEGR
jgi:uncharacterized membrane protein YdbT with pleckstrin-like domain